jgi:hypothetical protein
MRAAEMTTKHVWCLAHRRSGATTIACLASWWRSACGVARSPTSPLNTEFARLQVGCKGVSKRQIVELNRRACGVLRQDDLAHASPERTAASGPASAAPASSEAASATAKRGSIHSTRLTDMVQPLVKAADQQHEALVPRKLDLDAEQEAAAAGSAALMPTTASDVSAAAQPAQAEATTSGATDDFLHVDT